jgi:hypothetical protein
MVRIRFALLGLANSPGHVGSVNDWGYKILITAVGAQSSQKTAVRRLEVLQQLYSSLSRLHERKADTNLIASSEPGGFVRRIDGALVRFIDAYCKETNKSVAQLRRCSWSEIIDDPHVATLTLQYPLLKRASSEDRLVSLLSKANHLLSGGTRGTQGKRSVLEASTALKDGYVVEERARGGVKPFQALAGLSAAERGEVEMLAEAMNVSVEDACKAYLEAEKEPDQALTGLLVLLETGVIVPVGQPRAESNMAAEAVTISPRETRSSHSRRGANGKTNASVGASDELKPASSVAVQDSCGKEVSPLEDRFNIINQLNANFLECQSIINLGGDEEAFAIGTLVSRFRDYLFERSKAEVYTTSLQSSQVAGQAFELTLSRSKAMRFGSRGQVDSEGRWSIFGQVFRAVHGLDASVLRRSDLWKVLLAGERAQDAGGPYRESWSLMCAELMSSTLPLLVPSANNRTGVGSNRDAWVLNPGACYNPVQIQMLEFLGKLLGAAARSQNYLDLTIAPLIWKLIVGHDAEGALGLDELREVDTLTANSIDSICSFSGSESEFNSLYEDVMFTVTVTTATSVESSNVDAATAVITAAASSVKEAPTAELHSGGSTQVLRYENRTLYCEEVMRYRLNEFRPAALHVRKGLATQLPAAMLALLCGHELEALVCGNPDVDVALLRSVCDYSNYRESDDIVLWFWEILTECGVEDRKAFLRFIWGRSRLPLTKRNFTQRMKITQLDR